MRSVFGMRHNGCHSVAVGLTTVISLLHVFTANAADWYKGCLHAHTAWSDGRELPELAVKSYKDKGFNFVATTDHDVMMHQMTPVRYTGLAGSTVWMPSAAQRQWTPAPIPAASIAKAEQLFGPGWNVTSGTGSDVMVKLKTFDEINAKLGEAGKFLMIEGEEITSTVNIGGTTKSVHVNAINLAQQISPVFPANGTSVANTLNQDVASVTAQATRLNRTILAQVNHPNWAAYDITPEDLAQATGAQFFEVANESGDNLNVGNAMHPSTDKMWDIANTIRMTQLCKRPLYGTATDDAHFYNGEGPSGCSACPGNGWVMVRADALATDKVLDAMNRGDFYASTGVELRDIVCDSRVLRLEIAPEDGITYTTDFIGTLKGADPTKNANGTYSDQIGMVLKSVAGTSASYTMTGDELYVRAVVHSSKIMTNPPTGESLYERAWTQPVTCVPEPGSVVLASSAGLCIGVWAWRKCGLRGMWCEATSLGRRWRERR